MGQFHSTIRPNKEREKIEEHRPGTQPTKSQSAARPPLLSTGHYSPRRSPTGCSPSSHLSTSPNPSHRWASAALASEPPPTTHLLDCSYTTTRHRHRHRRTVAASQLVVCCRMMTRAPASQSPSPSSRLLEFRSPSGGQASPPGPRPAPVSRPLGLTPSPAR